MARRSDHSREEIHQMALAAAEEIVSKQGHSGLSARKIAAAIGYTVGTLYLVFDNLDDLVLQINGRTLDQLHNQMLQEQECYRDPQQKLLQLGHTYIRFADRNSHRWEMIFERRFRSGQDMPEWFRAKVARMFALVESTLAPLAGQHSSQEISQAARALWSGVHGICILAMTNKLDMTGVDSVHGLAQSLMTNYLKGFAAT